MQEELRLLSGPPGTIDKGFPHRHQCFDKLYREMPSDAETAEMEETDSKTPDKVLEASYQNPRGPLAGWIFRKEGR